LNSSKTIEFFLQIGKSALGVAHKKRPQSRVGRRPFRTW